MNGKYIVVKADGSIEIGYGEGKVTLAFMQEKVGGLIERISLPFETTIDLWCDEEGLFKDYKENEDVSDYLNYVWNSNRNRSVDYFHIKGDVLILGHDGENTVWLTDEEADKILKSITGMGLVWYRCIENAK